MKLSTFVVESARTLSTKLNINTPREINMLHSAIGVSTEVGEMVEAFSKKHLDIVNLGEELADIMWYVAIPMREFGISDAGLQRKGLHGVVGLEIRSANYLNMMKRVAFYGVELDCEEVVDHVMGLISSIYEIADIYSIDVETILFNNQEKLRKRFPDKYSNEHAIMRDTEEERKVLEKGM